MTHEILIHTTPHYLQVAYIENNHVCEIDMEPHSITMRVGDIYYAKVVRILTPMRVAFVEIGSARTALLHFTDIPLPEDQGFTQVEQYLRVGQLLMVQVSKLPRGDKGAIVTGRLQLIGALVIYQPLRRGPHGHIKVAQRITDAPERQRLYDIMATLAIDGTVMVRSKAANQPESFILQEFAALQAKWQEIVTRAKESKKPRLLQPEERLACTYIREHFDNQVGKIEIDNSECYTQLTDYMQTALPFGLACLAQVTEKRALWYKYQVEKTIQMAMAKKVALPSGGYIIIEATEAMTVIDVNTGQSVKSTYQTNIEAAQIITQQLRIRNIGGVIVVDFIRMGNVLEQQHIVDILTAQVAQDSICTMIYGFSPLGLVEINRQRHGNSWVEYYKNEDK